MQPDGSDMHGSIERISRVILKHTRIMVLEAAMNNASYPPMMRYLSKPSERCNLFEKVLKATTPASMSMLPESVRFRVFKGIQSAYLPVEINAGSIDAVHEPTLQTL